MIRKVEFYVFCPTKPTIRSYPICFNKHVKLAKNQEKYQFCGDKTNKRK